MILLTCFFYTCLKVEVYDYSPVMRRANPKRIAASKGAEKISEAYKLESEINWVSFF